MKKALITGNRGQDGAYLSRLLLSKGYVVYGADRAGDSGLWRLRELGIEGQVKDVCLDILELSNIMDVMDRVHPDEVYNFAAQSFVQTSFEQPILTAEINGVGVARMLEAIRKTCPAARFFQASTAELFGRAGEKPLTEGIAFYPKSPYSVAKLYGHWITVNYREAYGLHASCGILFNHESPLRGEEFVTRKITSAAARIKKGLQEKVQVGNLDARRDWGFAEEYVEGIWRILQQPEAGDYVLATGETHSVREFIEAAFLAAGFKLEWSGRAEGEKGLDVMTGKALVEVSKEFYRQSEVDFLSGDASKAKAELGWVPKVKFAELVSIMVKADIKRLEVKR
ncbi:MAG: GDP-mannose 4,6-dehydratase [Elusimicrobia bacterium CG08_land_8_20_14_0_20_59_10]|nr:MAG: GDP-mannose 4,6-dehydratase [Elusimicrobia bacterium CG08_land_8_20_14_0_20_59_10]